MILGPIEYKESGFDEHIAEIALQKKLWAFAKNNVLLNVIWLRVTILKWTSKKIDNFITKTSINDILTITR